jgi:hypothetical protein
VQLLAAAGAHDEYGGLICLILGVALYAFVVVKDYCRDVRYYRARRLVRDRDGVR